jgi:coproporphyrinogen III oxidase-like Fe-S oxidoreductase
VLTPQERVEEALFTGLRLARGIDLAEMKSRYDVEVLALYGRELEPFVDHGLLIYDDARMFLTRAGMLLAHEIMAVFISPSVR